MKVGLYDLCLIIFLLFSSIYFSFGIYKHIIEIDLLKNLDVTLEEFKETLGVEK